MHRKRFGREFKLEAVASSSKQGVQRLVPLLPDVLLSFSLVDLYGSMLLAAHGPLRTWAENTLHEWGPEAQFPQITKFSFAAVGLLQSWSSLCVIAVLVCAALYLQYVKKQGLLISVLLLLGVILLIRLAQGVLSTDFSQWV